MDISILLLWLAGIGMLADFIVCLLSRKYWQYGGHIICAMAYVILLADLTFTIWQDGYGTNQFRGILTATWLIGAMLVVDHAVIAYRHIRQNEKNIAIEAYAEQLETDLDQMKSKLNKLKQENERMQQNFQNQAEMMLKETQHRNERIISNMEYEEMLDDEERIGDTREAFQLYTLLGKNYVIDERGPKFEKKLHNVCEKICSHLKEDELRAILQLDMPYCKEAAEFYDATNNK